jgi:hypothetical protein
MPINLGFYVLLGLCVAASVAIYFVSRQRLPLKIHRFKGRERMPIEKLHGDYYPSSEMTKFVELWQEIASAVDVPPELMRLTDRFDGELGPVKGFEVASEMDDLEDALMRRCERQRLDFRKVRVETVDDYVKMFLEPIGT